jgi:Phycobilisome protein
MQPQLTRLTLSAEGRFATDGELQFLKDYLDRADERIEAYEKIRNDHLKIVEAWETAKRSRPEDLFHQNGRDISEICHRDAANIIRLVTNAMLFDDLDRLRDGFLVWYQTIVKSYQYKEYAKINYQILPEVLRSFLAPEEFSMILPIFQLTRAVLSA